MVQANDSAVRNCFGCEFLARLLGGHDNIAWPIKGKDLPVAVEEQTHCPHDAFDDFDLLVLLLSLPEQGSARGTIVRWEYDPALSCWAAQQAPIGARVQDGF